MKDEQQLKDARDLLRAMEQSLGEATTSIESLEAKLEKAREGLSITGAWLDLWAVHVGRCAGSQACSCGLTNARYEAAVALQELSQ